MYFWDTTLAIGLALKCGLREQEIVYLEWSDIYRQDKVLRVLSKPAYGFRVKDSEERDIPPPDDLLAELKQWHENHPKATPLLATQVRSTQPKAAAHAQASGQKREVELQSLRGLPGHLGECQEWTLHKFRRTYCATLLRSGLDLRTVQAYMGHADLASTMRYLRPASSAEAQDRINAIQW